MRARSRGRPGDREREKLNDIVYRKERDVTEKDVCVCVFVRVRGWEYPELRTLVGRARGKRVGWGQRTFVHVHHRHTRSHARVHAISKENPF